MADYFLTGPPFDSDEPIVPETRALENVTPAERPGDLNEFIMYERKSVDDLNHVTKRN